MALLKVYTKELTKFIHLKFHMVWQITKISFVCFSFFLSLSLFIYMHLQHFYSMAFVYSIMELVFFAIVWHIITNTLPLTRQYTHCLCLLHFIMKMLSKPLGHHSLIHCDKNNNNMWTYTDPSIPTHLTAAPPPLIILQSYTITMCPFMFVWIYRFGWLWFCGPFCFPFHRHCNATYPSCIYSSIYSLIPFPRSLASPLQCVVYFWLCCCCCCCCHCRWWCVRALSHKTHGPNFDIDYTYYSTNDIRLPLNENVTGK